MCRWCDMPGEYCRFARTPQRDALSGLRELELSVFATRVCLCVCESGN